MRVGFVTQWFPPEPGTFVSAAIADGLAERGHEVHVVTGFPNYPNGRLQPGYPLRPYRRESRGERVTVHRAPLYPSHDSSALRRAANYLSFAAGASWVSWHSLERPDVWLTYSSPATAAVPALTAPRRLRAPHCLLIEDLWPDSVMESGMADGALQRRAHRALDAYCSWTYRNSETIGVIAPGMVGTLTRRGVPASKLAVVPNCLDDSHLLPNVRPSDDLKATLGLPRGRIFMYAGNMGELQALEALVKSFAACPEATLVLVGDGVAAPRVRVLVARLGAHNVHLVGPQSATMIGRFIAASDVQIVSLRDTPLLRVTMPSKLQSAMAARRPVLVHAAGDVADTTTAASCGVVARPGDREQTVRAIRRLVAASSAELEAMGDAGRDYFERNFSLGPGLRRLEQLLEHTASKKGSSCNRTS